MDFDDILTEIGECGPYQLVLIVLLCFPVAFAVPYTFMGQLFQTLTPAHWCHVPELAGTEFGEDVKKSVSIPQEVHDGTMRYSRCVMYDRDYSQLLTLALSNATQLMESAANATSKQVQCEHGWDYDTKNFRPTATSEFNWVCTEDWKGYVTLGIFFTGSAVGSLVYGFMSDRYGRLLTLILVNGMAFLANFTSAFTQGFASFAVVRFVAGTTFDMSVLAFFILVMEYVGPRYRNKVCNFTFGVFFTLGSVVLPWIAYYMPNWRYFSIAASIPFLLILPFFRFIPESARWLVSQNRVDDAIVILKNLSKRNKKEKKQPFWDAAKESLIEGDALNHEAAKYTVLDLFRRPRLRNRMILVASTWLIVMLSYDALVRNTENLGWDVYMSSTLGNATELPAAIIPILLLDRIGRRLCSVVCFAIGAILCLTVLAVPLENTSAFVTLAVMARLIATILMNVFFLYKTELFPTVLRGQAVSLAHLIGFIGSMASPLIVYLGQIHKYFPIVILGGAMALGTVLVSLLPETLYETIPETYEDGENFALDQAFLHFPRPKVNQGARGNTTQEQPQLSIGMET